jgi:hypothetical protein
MSGGFGRTGNTTLDAVVVTADNLRFYHRSQAKLRTYTSFVPGPQLEAAAQRGGEARMFAAVF